VQVDEGIPPLAGGTPLPVEDYAYDEEGNRTASHLSALYASNDHNQLLEDDAFTYAYDAKGNRISKTAKVGGAVETYTYDSQNRLVEYGSDTVTASYWYDAMDRRISKSLDGALDVYIYDRSIGGTLIHDDIILEFDASASPVLTRRWLHSDSVDEPIGFEEYQVSSGVGSGSERSMFSDRQGSVLWITEPTTGSVVAAYEYDSYGAIVQTQGALRQPYGYTGREYDHESGLYFYRARSYDPTSGLFLQVDPVEFQSGTMNLTGYTSQNPSHFSDPSGLTIEMRQQIQNNATNAVIQNAAAHGAILLAANTAQALMGMLPANANVIADSSSSGDCTKT